MYLNIEYFYYKIYNFIAEGYKFATGQETNFKEAIGVFEIVSFALSLVLIMGIFYNVVFFIRIRKTHLSDLAKFIFEEVPPDRRVRWEKIKKYLDSNNVSDWRWAIMEADGLSEDILKKIGYPGQTFSERLSKIKPSQFKNLDDLWRAHKFRNRIAHRGGEMELTKAQAEKALELYENALNELEYL